MYRPGKTNIADGLSRLNSVKQLDCGEEYDFIRAVVESCVPVTLSPKEIEKASYDDEERTVPSEELCEIWELGTVRNSKTNYAPMASFCFVIQE